MIKGDMVWISVRTLHVFMGASVLWQALIVSLLFSSGHDLVDVLLLSKPHCISHYALFKLLLQRFALPLMICFVAEKHPSEVKTWVSIT